MQSMLLLYTLYRRFDQALKIMYIAKCYTVVFGYWEDRNKTASNITHNVVMPDQDMPQYMVLRHATEKRGVAI